MSKGGIFLMFVAQRLSLEWWGSSFLSTTPYRSLGLETDTLDTYVYYQNGETLAFYLPLDT